MQLKIEPSGIHYHKGKLKVRVDLIPDPTDESYVDCYVNVPIREPTEEEQKDPKLAAKIPTKKQLNPCLSHFFEVEPGMTKTEVNTIIAGLFPFEDLRKLDHDLHAQNREAVFGMMRTKKRSVPSHKENPREVARLTHELK